MQQTTEQTLKLVEAIKGQQTVEKAFTTTLGLNWYDLEPAAKLLYPVITPLRNLIPRVSGDGGTATNWKAITGIDTTKISPGVSEGNRNATIVTTESDFAAAYRGLGLEDYETFEAEYGSKNFDNLRALMTQGLLNALMIAEEQVILGGNSSDASGIALGTPATPTVATSTTGGTLAAATYLVRVVALTLDGFQRSTVAGGVATTIARTNADASADTVKAGSSNKSAAASQVTTGATSTVTASVTAIKGAVAYAWYWGVGAGNEILGAITTVNTVVISATATGTQNASAITVDNSQNALVFTGLISQILNSTSSGYWKSLDGATLTTDNAGGIVEVDAALKSFWDVSRVSPTHMIVNSQELLNITKKVIASGGGTLFQFTQPNGNTVESLTLAAGQVVGSYLNKFTMAGGQMIKIMLHPNVPPGMIVFYSTTIPYPISRIRNILQVKTRKEYYQIEWPFKSRKYEAGVYCDELLQLYATFAFGAIGNIANG